MINVADLPKIIWGWIIRVLVIGLVAFFALTLIRLFGVNLYPVTSDNLLNLGAFFLGSAYFLNSVRNL